MSSKTKIIYALIFIILLLVSIKAGFAMQEDFNVYASNKVLYVCACSGVENTITLENTGDVASVYGIRQEGSAAGYSSISPLTFSLKPGESSQLHNFITVPCGIEGKFDLNTEIDTTFGSIKQLEQSIDIRKCVNVDIVQVKEPESVCPCSPARYDFLIKNTGDFVETYTFNVTPFPEYVSVSDDFVILGPGQGKEIYIFVNAQCGVFGQLDFSLAVDAQKGGMRAELPFKLTINPCYDYSVTSAESYSVCRDLKSIVSVLITNNADVANSYFLSTDNSIGFFENNFLSLGKKHNASVNLILYPAAAAEGTFNITIRSVSERGQLPVEKPMEVKVENCYSINLSVEEVPDLVSCEEYVARGYAFNDGSRESLYSFTLFGEPWASLGLSSLPVKAGETKEIPMKFNVPCNLTGTYEFTLAANVTNFPEKVAQNGFTVNVVAVEDAYGVEINSIDERIETNYEGAVVPITISNIGIRGGNYNVILNSTGNWISIDKKKLNIPPGGFETVNLVLSPTEETSQGGYDVSLTVVSEGWNVGYERSFTVILKEKTLLESIFDAWLYILAGVLFIVLVVVLLLVLSKSKGKKEEEFWESVEGEPSVIREPEKEEKLLEVEKKDRKWLRWLFTILVALALLGVAVAGIYFASSYFKTTGNETNETEVAEPIEEIPEEELPINETGPGLISRINTWLFGEANETEEEVIEEEVPEQPTEQSFVENATIYVNRTGLKGYGDLIEVSGAEEITIPLIIQNNYKPNTFRIMVNVNADWISVDKQAVQIAPNERETINIIVTPSEQVEEGDYKINIRIDIEGKATPISEEIVLRIAKETPFHLRYLWYMLGGLAVLVLLAVIAGIRGWLRRREEKGFEEPIKEAKKTEDIGGDIFAAEKKDYSWLKYMLLGILIIVILAGIIYGVVYSVKNVLPRYYDETAESGLAEEPVEEEPVEQMPEEPVVEVPKIEYKKVFVKKSQETQIPMRISNANKTATFKIKVNEGVEWITVDRENVEIGPDQSEVVNLMASPDESIEDGNYKVSVDVEVAGEEKRFTQGFILQVRKNKYSPLWSYLAYALAGLVVLFITLLVFRAMERKGLHKPEETGEAKEKVAVKKTNIQLK